MTRTLVLVLFSLEVFATQSFKLTVVPDAVTPTRQFLENAFPVDILGQNRHQGLIEFLADDTTIKKIERLGFEMQVTDLQDPSRALDPRFMDLAGVEKKLRDLHKRFPKLTQLVALTDRFPLRKTTYGNHVWALKISDNAAVREDEPRILFNGNHHAREIQTPLAVVDMAEWLLTRYQTHAEVKDWIDSTEIWLVPVVNPDGYHYVWTKFAMWRKNRSGKGEHGVDLNRNYPFKWGACGNHSSSIRSDVYKGPAAGSETEVQAMTLLAGGEKFWITISYHSYGREVLYPYVCGTLADKDVYMDVMESYRKAMKYDHRLASSSGEDFEDHYARTGSLSFLTELSAVFQPDYDDFVKDELPRIRAGWQHLLRRLKGAWITGHVVDAKTGKPLIAQISLANIQFQEGESPRESDAMTGRFHWPVKAGKYIVTVRRKGFKSITRQVSVGKIPAYVRFELNQTP